MQVYCFMHIVFAYIEVAKQLHCGTIKKTTKMTPHHWNRYFFNTDKIELAWSSRFSQISHNAPTKYAIAILWKNKRSTTHRLHVLIIIQETTGTGSKLDRQRGCYMWDSAITHIKHCITTEIIISSFDGEQLLAHSKLIRLLRNQNACLQYTHPSDLFNVNSIS